MFSGNSRELMVMKFSVDREKQNLIQCTRALLLPVYSVILTGFLIFAPFDFPVLDI